MTFFTRGLSLPGPRVLLFTTLSIAIAHGNAAHAQSDGAYRVVVEGFAYGQGLSTRDEAVSDAQRRAVALWLETNLGSISEEDAHHFLNLSSAFVLSRRVLEQRHENQGVRLSLEAYLDATKLRLEAAQYFLPRLKSPPKVVFMVGQRHPSGSYTMAYDSAAVRALQSVFESSGFSIVPESVVREYFTEIELAGRISGGPEIAAKVGRTVQADIVVMGEVRVTAQAGERRGNLSLYRGVAKLGAVRAYDGAAVELLEAESEVTSARPEDGIEVAVQDAVYKVQQKLLVAAALASLKKPGGRVVHITVEGEAVQRRLPQIQAMLQAAPSVTRIETLRTRAQLVLLRFSYDGAMGDLVEYISAVPFEGFRLEPRQIIGSDMNFRALPQ